MLNNTIYRIPFIERVRSTLRIDCVGHRNRRSRQRENAQSALKVRADRLPGRFLSRRHFPIFEIFSLSRSERQGNFGSRDETAFPRRPRRKPGRRSRGFWKNLVFVGNGGGYLRQDNRRPLAGGRLPGSGYAGPEHRLRLAGGQARVRLQVCRGLPDAAGRPPGGGH